MFIRRPDAGRTAGSRSVESTKSVLHPLLDLCTSSRPTCLVSILGPCLNSVRTRATTGGNRATLGRNVHTARTENSLLPLLVPAAPIVTPEAAEPFGIRITDKVTSGRTGAQPNLISSTV